MTTGNRILKQIFVAVVFLIVVSGIAFGGYFVFRKPVPTPTPNPTINLAPISIISTQLFNITDNDYDFLAKVGNSNTDYGSGDVEYQLTFFDTSGQQISQKQNSFYILPGQTKYIIESPLKFNQPVAKVIMAIKSVDWQKLDPLASSNISFLPSNYSYNETSQAGVFSKVGGSILNNSDLDLGQVSVVVLLFDGSDSVIGVNKTEILTFLAKTTRGFEVAWYTPFVGKVARTEVNSYTDVFENSNFLSRYGRPEKFQQFY